MTDCVVVLEPAGDGSWSADVPDLPCVVAVGRDPAAAESGIREAIEFHRDELRRRGEVAPPARSRATVIAV